MVAAEYKSRCNDLEHSLDTARSVVSLVEYIITENTVQIHFRNISF